MTHGCKRSGGWPNSECCVPCDCHVTLAIKPIPVPERLNPLLKPDALKAADEAACRLDGLFRDLFNAEDRMDLIVTIIRAATIVALGLPSERSA